MLKPSRIICPAVTVLLVIGAFFWVQGGERPAVRPSSPVVLAMQESASTSADHSPRVPLSNVGWIGVMIEENQGHGVRVAGVFPAGPAAMAGVRVGDTLLRVAGADLVSTPKAEAAIEQLVPEKPASLTVLRGGKNLELKVIPGSLAEFKRDYVSEMMRRDPRDAKYGMHHGVSEADMSAELIRRLFEQHERLERSLNDVLKEVRELRKQVAALQK